MADDDTATRTHRIEVVVSADPALMAVLNRLAGITSRPAVKAVLTVGETPDMPPVQITIDTTNATATVGFVDDHGDPTTAPAGMTVAFTSDNPAAATIAADPANPYQGDITPAGIGTTNIGATLTDADGNTPPLEADGVTPWPAIGSVSVEVDPGAAVGAQLTVNP